ncbi:low temperature requirement protein A [Nonomuraea mangrovi]|uniref:Low temperature requirement protein A n=1 Tax=Nonomuraea mangrovi TaxID=2316207 RepID=A0ABW4SXT2_9ACTN
MNHTDERHASWLELFFDLVVVVAVAQLAHRLHHPTWAVLALFAVLYYAVWSVWTSLTLYSNVEADRTRTRSMLIGMFCIAVMAAAAPHVADNLPGEPGTHDTAFVLAYVICRISASRSLQATGAVITAWPAAQLGIGLGPWIGSLFVDDPLWRYLLWGIGMALDVVFTVIQARNPERLVDEMRQHHARLQARELRRGGALRRIEAPAAAVLHTAHLGERLGLFVIIVLGEAVMQVVMAASGQEEWGQSLVLAALAGFGLIVCLWWLTLHYGLSAVPEAGEQGLKPYLLLPAHFVMTASITTVAAGLGLVAEHTEGHVPDGIRWLLCGGLAAYFAVSTLLGVFAKAGRRWILLWALPTVVAPLLAGLLAGPLPGWGLVALMLAIALWRVIYKPPAPAAGPVLPA